MGGRRSLCHAGNFDGISSAIETRRALPGSHCLGRLSAERIREMRDQQSDFLCAVSAGDALLMRPLLLHSSGRSTSARHRRVLHIEYAAFTLTPGLNWHEEA